MSAAYEMNESRARSALSRPLTFGDDEQIRAIRFMDAVSEAVDAIKESRECENCGGRGRFLHPCDCQGGNEDCDDCCGDGEYLDDCCVCDALGYFVVDWPVCRDEVMKAAISRIKKERLLRD